MDIKVVLSGLDSRQAAFEHLSEEMFERLTFCSHIFPFMHLLHEERFFLLNVGREPFGLSFCDCFLYQLSLPCAMSFCFLLSCTCLPPCFPL